MLATVQSDVHHIAAGERFAHEHAAPCGEHRPRIQHKVSVVNSNRRVRAAHACLSAVVE